MTTLSHELLQHPPALFVPAWADSTKVLADTARIAREALAPKTYDIDLGYYPLDIMAQLGAAGALAPHMSSQGLRFDLAIDAMRAVSRVCGTTGFMTWAHHACGLYLDQSENPAIHSGEVIRTHMHGQTFGGTALSNPMKAWTDIEPMALRAQKVPGGYTISGSLPWVSHIGRDQYCGAVAQVEGSGTPYDILFLLGL